MPVIIWELESWRLGDLENVDNCLVAKCCDAERLQLRSCRLELVLEG